MRILFASFFVLAFVAVASAAAPHTDLTKITTQHLYDNLQGILNAAAGDEPSVTIPSQCQAQLQAASSTLQNQGQCLQNQPQFGPGKSLTKDQLDQVCGQASCLRTVFPIFRNLVDCIANAGDPKTAEAIRSLFSTVFSVFDFICTRDDAGQYCALTWQDPAFPNAVAVKNPDTCAFFVGTGCCARTFLKFMALTSSSFGGIGSSTVNSALNQTIVYCGMSDGPGCPAPGVIRKTIAVTWVLNNFNCTWLAQAPPATAKLLLFYLARDISRFLGVRVGAVAVAKLLGCSRTVTPQSIEHHFDLASAMSLQATATAPITVQFNVRGDNDAQTNALLAAVQTQSASSALVFTDTQAAVPGVGSLSNNPSAATVTTASIGSGLSPAARSTTVQVLAVLGAAVIALLAGKHM